MFALRVEEPAMSAKPANKRQLQREQTRAQILEAAIELFAKAGFDATSLGQIAAVAGVKKALIQYHFNNKDALWRAAATLVFERRNQRIIDYLQEIGTDPDVAVELRRSFTVIIKFTRDNPHWLWFMFHEAAADNERLQWLLENYQTNDFVLGEGFIKYYQDAGLLRPGPPIHMLHLISGALTYNLLVAPLTLRATDTDLASDEAIATQVDLLLDLILVPENGAPAS